MRKPRLLLDCDGLLSNFIAPCLDVIHSVVPQRFVHDDVREWAIEKALGIPAETWDLVCAKMQEPGFCASIPMYEGTQRAVARLREVADLFIVTSPMGGPNWTHEREEWLKRHFNISRANVAHISTKYIVTGDVFMDDKTSHLVEWRKHNPNGVAVRWDRLYNADDVWDGLHTDNWDVFLGIVMGVGAKLA